MMFRCFFVSSLLFIYLISSISAGKLFTVWILSYYIIVIYCSLCIRSMILNINNLHGTFLEFTGTECFENNIEYTGNNLNNDSERPNYGLTDGKRESPKECQKLCQQTNGCLVFTYEQKRRACWLKSEDSIKKNQSGSISGRNYCEGNL